MLARATGLPARLATGYLPGERDLLSGAYRVEREDVHAWAEILFWDHGWTLREYTWLASEQIDGAEEQLAWFTEAAWVAAYDPVTFPEGLVPEARARLASFKAALG